MAQAVARLITEGGQRVARMIAGIQRDIADAEKRIRSESERTARGERKNQQDQTRARREGARAASDEVAKSERAKRDEFARTTRAAREAAQAEARETERSAQAQAAAIRRARGGGAGGGGAGGGGRRPRRDDGGLAGELLGATGIPLSAGAALGAVVSALNEIVSSLSRVTTALEGAAGVQDTGQRTVSAQEFQLQLTRLGGEVFSDMSPADRAQELEQVRQEIDAIAQATHQSPGELLGALSNLQTEFSAFDFGRENLQAMAEEATRTGTSVETLARFSGLVRQQFGEMDTSRMLDITAQGGLQGALDPESLSRAFAGQLGLFQSFVDPNHAGSAEQNFRSFVATANVLKQSGLGANESATLMQNMWSSLARPQVQQRIRRATGVDVRNFRDENGRLNMGEYIGALQASGRFNSLETILRAVHDQQASQAINTLISARSRVLAGTADSVDIGGLEGVSAEAGNAFRKGNFSDVMATDAMRLRGIGVGSEIEGQNSMVARGARAEMGMLLRQQLTGRGVVGETLAGSDWLTSGLGAVMSNRTVASVLRNPVMRAAATGAGNAIGTGGGIVTDAAYAALDQPQATAAGPKRPGVTGAQVEMSTASQDRLADRIGQSVARNLAPALRDSGRNSGGPASRTGG